MVKLACCTDRSVISSSVLSCAGIGRACALLEVLAEPVELALPAGPPVRYPLLGRPHGGGLDAAGPGPADLLRPDEPACLEHMHVLHHSGKRHAQRPGELADRCWPEAEPLHHEPPARIG